MAQLLPRDADGENRLAVAAFQRLQWVRDRLGGAARRQRAASSIPGWPPLPGDYVVGDATAPVAVCTLSDRTPLEPLAALPGVAIAGRLVTVNLGIERLLTNTTANPNIRFLLLCGRDSPVFHTAQGLGALIANGVTPEQRIIDAQGHFPVLANVTAERIARFRRQIQLIDLVGIDERSRIAREIAEAARRAAQLDPLTAIEAETVETPHFTPLPAGGQRRPVGYDPKGFFIISVDPAAGEILCRHYWPDHNPGHEIRSHSAERVLLGLLRAELVTQLDHAGYLGAELAKAETALRLGLDYHQDRRLARR
ncbi:DUF4346 domain-containing protein [Marichromatium bheemlicum]|uniref:Tetrahydromethanopterin S-methyltransferase subunit A n=1 Tax=Marichromatium bheemlicum TaxID=365339 RepID=A0ABX1ICW6_9GAMM|nr:tetrahydromethanopterin S-methyltransferase subunit A [Marichromatium bheemlicum]NKN34032.1 tetrahydromethanopterin S-methyltransferase subunit A [Marichromatium bheemlicum]